MKIYWDNIESLHLTKGGNLRNINGKKFYYFKICKCCGEECLVAKKDALFCSSSCSNTGEYNGMYGKKPTIILGRRASKETREKMSLAQRGIKNHFYGKKHTKKSIEQMVKANAEKIEETKIKISNTLKGRFAGKKNPFYGKRHSEKTKQTIRIKNSSGRFKSENNPNWKGGISKEPYCQNWTKELKKFIKQRDGYKCMNPCCKAKNPNDLTVHHIDYNKKNCDTSNLITICRSCNARANFNREKHMVFYQKIMGGSRG